MKEIVIVFIIVASFFAGKIEVVKELRPYLPPNKAWYMTTGVRTGTNSIVWDDDCGIEIKMPPHVQNKELLLDGKLKTEITYFCESNL